ncbi:Activator of basal transcription 1 [Liparis tanakae]|uniref:Activator of basal transcription 1 n=1 Tax=Liparis tanakae TaxID=230148 RepID=A0A4Z2FUL8_9TELE|nr:Activator of basal transcription 1 [Liparis tanakae]
MRNTTAQVEEEEMRKTTAQVEEEEEMRKTTAQIEEGGDDEEDEHSEGEEEQNNNDEEEEEEENENSDGEEAKTNDDDDAAEMKKNTRQSAAELASFPDRKCVPDSQLRWRKRRSGMKRCDFTEGWVEFRDKRVAKRVVLSLHNTPMGTRKRQHFSSDLWSMKYLHRFQWTHLSERLAFEQTVLQQRLRTEVSQAKRETNFYLNNVDKSARMDHLRKRRQRDGQEGVEKTWDFTQRETEEEIQVKKLKRKDSVTQKHLDKARLIQQQSQSNVSLLAKIFNSKKAE